MVRIGGDEGGGGEKPAWLQGLMGETFFGGCGVHHSRRKNEKNIFCLDCCLSFCPHCLPSHRSHPLLQVRRYVYHDVVRLVDLQKLIDCSFIQPYTINGAKVIFVKQRSQSSSRQWKGSSSPNVCFTCHRILQPPFHFCSLSCKVEHMVYRGEGMTWASSSQLEGLRVDNSHLLDDDDRSMTAEAAAHDPSSYTSSPEQCNDEEEDEDEEEEQVVSVGRRKKASGGGSSSGSRRFLSVFSNLSSRRKGAPHRAPLS